MHAQFLLLKCLWYARVEVLSINEITIWRQKLRSKEGREQACRKLLALQAVILIKDTFAFHVQGLRRLLTLLGNIRRKIYQRVDFIVERFEFFVQLFECFLTQDLSFVHKVLFKYEAVCGIFVGCGCDSEHFPLVEPYLSELLDKFLSECLILTHIVCNKHEGLLPFTALSG